MQVSVDIEISSPNEKVWGAITDIENCAKFISGIIDVEVLNKAGDNLVGLKWKETRIMFGKEASETMWITDEERGQVFRGRIEPVNIPPWPDHSD